ncbi:DUF4274 domain-containing protein [Rossellomorea marisflavi]|uniref:DUF4274 domain-containing protein n=1 Tax=Rossellomorea marisflavi TaxID=189381 RepID=UPI00064F43F7|nr:DUF4274 domain-containing protein [Rossellomorea marisflavi]KMK93109.1 hypothetical protein VL03_14830 [Rossellomorea marisflavi]
MDKIEFHFLEQLLYHTDKEYVVSQIKNVDNPLFLHYFAGNYDWDSGFEVPTVILDHEACDLGTGLLMFHYADGYRMLERSEGNTGPSLMEWIGFLTKIYTKLVNLDFKSRNISFDPGLTKIQKYKMKKDNPELPDVLIDKSPGGEIEIPKLS